MKSGEPELRSVSLLARVRWLVPAAVWLVGFALERYWAPSRAYLAACVWGMLLLASFVAWGALVSRRLLGTRRLDWALYGVFGMALALAWFATLACFSLVSAGAIVFFCALGPVAWGAFSLWLEYRRDPSPGRSFVAACRRGWARQRSPVFVIAVGVLYVMALLHYAGAVTNTSFNMWDDEMAYRSFARQFLDTGTLLEPFSFRRVGSYGGQSLLEAMALAAASRDCLHVVDGGMCVLLLLGLIVGYRGGPPSATRAAALAAGFMAMTLPHQPHNIGSEISGVVIFVALFRVLDEIRFEELRPWAYAALVGALAAAVSTLRQTYMVAAALLLGFVCLSRVVYPDGRPRRAQLRNLVLTLVATIGFLVPWMVMSAGSIGTAFYPLLHGNLRRDFGMVGSVDRGELVRWTLANVFVFWPVSSIALLFLAAVMLPFGRSARALHALMGACVLAFLVMMHFFQAFHDSSSINRYYLGFTLAFALAAVLRSVTDGARSTRATAPAAIALCALGAHFLSAKEGVLNLYFERVTAVTELRRKTGPDPVRPPFADVYRRLQNAVPRGAPLLVTLDHTYLLDGTRNRIFNYDHPGAMGPAGGPPCFQGAEAFARYLRKVGIRYIAYQVGPSSPEYWPEMWQQRKVTPLAPNGRGAFYQNQSRFELDFFDDVTELQRTRRSLFEEGELHVLDLAARR
jgi:hypothetical protein